jgi:hypothetical protein
MKLHAILLGACAALPLLSMPARAADEAPPPPAKSIFDFHSAFLVNLHHFLYDAAVRPKHLEDRAWAAKPGDAEMATLREAVAYYAAHYGQRDLLFDDGMRALDTALAGADDAQRRARGLALPADLAEVLDRAAPVYARCLWPAQDAANRSWIARAKVLDSRYGAAIRPALERVFAHPLPAVVRDDVVFESGEFTGAYTGDDPPHSILPSGWPAYDGLAALEMIYHEAVHAHADEPLMAAIDAATDAAHRPRDEHLWHAAHFYAVGLVVQDVLRRDGGVAYVPYADARGLYARSWSAYLPVLQDDWRAYVEGRGTLQQAARAMVAHLPG